MRRLLLIATILAAVVIGLAVIGPSLPEGNPLRTVGESMRDIGEGIARGFGGGYGELPAGGG